MSDFEVRIERLSPRRVASFHAFGKSPEPDAYTMMLAWAEPRGLLRPVGEHRIFGFDNPSPSAGSPNYGYELWIDIGPNTEEVPEAKEFEGGLYAVARVTGIRNIGAVWRRLSTWVENSRYGCGRHHWLEEHVGPVIPTQHEDEVVLDLFCPISE